jgi:hypothetical protein
MRKFVLGLALGFVLTTVSVSSITARGQVNGSSGTAFTCGPNTGCTTALPPITPGGEGMTFPTVTHDRQTTTATTAPSMTRLT